MKKPIICLLIFYSFSFSGCKSMQNPENNSMAIIVYSGNKLAISNDQTRELLQLVMNTFTDCSDIYNLIVTRKTVDDIRKGSSYLEINFSKNQEMNIGSSQKVKLTRLLIPLSGKFAGSDQLTFFFGNPEYSSGPLVNNKGRAELIRKIESFK